MDWTETIRRLLEAAGPYLTVRGDQEHIRISHLMACKLLDLEGGDRRLAEPAIILHDVGWSALKPEEIKGSFGLKAKGERARRMNRRHEVAGVEIAGNILREMDYDPSLTKKILKIIDHHDSGLDADSLEEKIVKDADKLWRYTTDGFWVEKERQGVTAEELYLHRTAKIEEWFFLDSSRTMALEELQGRRVEIDSGRDN